MVTALCNSVVYGFVYIALCMALMLGWVFFRMVLRVVACIVVRNLLCSMALNAVVRVVVHV